ncbi:MAG: arylesterase [Zoogloeaceae bacterium]|nr:arylesterase [Zoogloeaceae bacterium]
MVFAFLLLGSFAAAAAPRILVWGDSLSAGYGLRANEAWPTLLQSALTRKGFLHTVVNASVSGETSAGGRSRLPQALKEHRPAIVIIELGANDGLRGLPPQMMADNLRAMVDMVRQAGARPLLIGMEMPPNFGSGYVNRFRQAYAEVAQATASRFVPFLMAGFAQRQELFQADGIHPTKEAQPMIVDTVWPGLEPLLKER